MHYYKCMHTCITTSVCSTCTCITTSVCSTCTCITISVCSTCTCITISVCSTCTFIIISVCSTCTCITIRVCSTSGVHEPRPRRGRSIQLVYKTLCQSLFNELHKMPIYGQTLSKQGGGTKWLTIHKI